MLICYQTSQTKHCRGKAIPFLNENGKVLENSISEKIYVDIGGTKLGMFIKGEDKSKPVLLFLHGGPGMPENWMHQIHPSGIEKEFVVCWWEQRGAGISYDADIMDTVTEDQRTLKQAASTCQRLLYL